MWFVDVTIYSNTKFYRHFKNTTLRFGLELPPPDWESYNLPIQAVELELEKVLIITWFCSFEKVLSHITPRTFRFCVRRRPFKLKSEYLRIKNTACFFHDSNKKHRLLWQVWLCIVVLFLLDNRSWHHRYGFNLSLNNELKENSQTMAKSCIW